MDLRTTLAQRVFLPIYERRWGVNSGEILQTLRKSQYASRDELLERQWIAFRDMVEFAYRTTTFYRNRFTEIGFEPGDLKNASDLARLPLLQKDDIRQHTDAMLRDGRTRADLFHKRTGGSTGVPVHVYWDENAMRFKNAVVRRHDDWAGYRSGMKRAALWGDTDKKYPWKERVYKSLCERTIFLDTLQMDEMRLLGFVDSIRRFRPDALVGHAHSIYFFTQFLVDHGIEDVGFKSIISTAETLVPAERELIELRFGRVLFDRYGCEEISLIASECESHEGLHVSAEGLLLEVLEGDDETPGRIVATDLVNRGMPLIRYEVGDLATTLSSSCACGRGLPRLGRVYGRTTDILYAPDGRQISGVSILDTFLIHVPGVRQAQIIQDEFDHVTLKIVSESDFDGLARGRLANIVTQVFGPTMRHDVHEVPSIEPTNRGKYQFSICEIRPEEPERP